MIDLPMNCGSIDPEQRPRKTDAIFIKWKNFVPSDDYRKLRSSGRRLVPPQARHWTVTWAALDRHGEGGGEVSGR